MNTEQKRAFLNAVAVMVPHSEDEAMRVDCVVEDEVFCTGKDSGEEYVISLDDITVEDYMFYRLTLVTPEDIFTA